MLPNDFVMNHLGLVSRTLVPNSNSYKVSIYHLLIFQLLEILIDSEFSLLFQELSAQDLVDFSPVYRCLHIYSVLVR